MKQRELNEAEFQNPAEYAIILLCR